MTSRAAILALIALAIRVPGDAASNWTRVATPHVEIVTDAGETAARELLPYIEAIRAVVRAAGIADTPIPLRVFLFAKESDYRVFNDDKASVGFYRNGSRDYIAMCATADARHVITHEYMHAVLRHSNILLPKWFDEGAAEFYSNLEIDGDRLRIGDPIGAHLARLQIQPWFAAADLANAHTDPLYYAESWALVHMLSLAPAWREGLPRFIAALAEGREPDAAFHTAFGKTLDDAVAALPPYLRVLHGASIPLKITPERDTARVEHLTPLDAAIERVELLDRAHHVERPDQASPMRKIVMDAIRGQPESAEIATALGSVAMAEGNDAEAERHFARAIDLGSRDPETWFQYAMLMRDTDRVKSDELLARAVAIDPSFAEAQFLLGEHESQNGNYAAAIAHLKEAVRVRPAESNYWYALALAQQNSGGSHDAVASARRAKATAENDRDARAAETLIVSLGQPAPTPAPLPQTPIKPAHPPIETGAGQRSDVITPSSWQNPRGDARVEGTLTRVDCENDFARLHVTDASGKIIPLSVHHPDEVELVNAAGVDHVFSCGAQSVAVSIEYVKSTAEVTRIEFR